MLLSDGTIGDALVTELDATGRDLLESFAVMEEERKPRLPTRGIASAGMSTACCHGGETQG